MALREQEEGGEKVTSPVADSELKLSLSRSCGNMKKGTKTGITDHVDAFRHNVRLQSNNSPKPPQEEVNQCSRTFLPNHHISQSVKDLLMSSSFKWAALL